MIAPNMHMAVTAAPGAASLVGWRNFKGERAVLHTPLESFGPEGDQRRIERLARLRIKLTEYRGYDGPSINFIIGRVVDAQRKYFPELIVASMIASVALENGSTAEEVLDNQPGEYLMTDLSTSKVRLGRDSGGRLGKMFAMAGIANPLCFEATLQPNGSVAIYDESQYGSCLYANWQGAFIGAPVQGPADQNSGGQLVYLSSKSIS